MVVPLHWHNEPLLLISLLGAGWVYALGTGPFRSKIAPRGTPYPTRQAVAFYASLIINYLAVGSPLDQFGEDYLFSVHMVQHLLLAYVTPPLMLFGTPWWLADAALARPWVKRLARPFLHPAVCCVSFAVVFAMWHLPELFESALRSRPIHIFEHITIFFTATQMWWIFLGPSKVFPPCSYLVRILCTFFLTAAHMPILGLLAFSDNPLYRTYELAPRLIAGFDAKQDQVLGGAIMETVAALVSVGLLCWSLWSWMNEDDRRQSRPSVLARPGPDIKPAEPPGLALDH